MKHWKKSINGFLTSVMMLSVFISVAQTRPEEVKATIKQKPDDERFTPVVLSQDLDEPMVFEVAKNGKVYVAERKGGIKVYDPLTEKTSLVGTIQTMHGSTNKETGQTREADQGFVGMTLDPKFEVNHWAYLFYQHATEAKVVLVRREIVNDKLVPDKEKILFEYPSVMGMAHTGGGMTWDSKGNL
ncbi:MAG TPA: PQQ-dependent sugar dehydrogenase, partial [Cyclobacteriaceae bacterium]|nr:PQQ-dependent sugar dehydrogenase [Cyclobacteriaceae bacterium]